MSDTDKKTTKKISRGYIPAIALSGVAAALVFVATLISFPAGPGNLNMGDGVILLCAYILGPVVFFPAAIGSALCDLALGYTVYIPATFFIKGLLGLFAALIMRGDAVSIPRKAIAFVVAEIIMVGGYFSYEILIYGVNTAVADVPMNLIQGAVAIGVAFILTLALGSIRPHVVRTFPSGKK